MAQIDEEKILIRFSQLVRDSDNTANVITVNEALRSNIEIAATNILQVQLPNAFVLVEATIVNGNI